AAANLVCAESRQLAPKSYLIRPGPWLGWICVVYALEPFAPAVSTARRERDGVGRDAARKRPRARRVFGRRELSRGGISGCLAARENVARAAERRTAPREPGTARADRGTTVTRAARGVAIISLCAALAACGDGADRAASTPLDPRATPDTITLQLAA